MLQEWKAMEKPEEEEIRVRLAAAKEKLAKTAPKKSAEREI